MAYSVEVYLLKHLLLFGKGKTHTHIKIAYRMGVAFVKLNI